MYIQIHMYWQLVCVCVCVCVSESSADCGVWLLQEGTSRGFSPSHRRCLSHWRCGSVILVSCEGGREVYRLERSEPAGGAALATQKIDIVIVMIYVASIEWFSHPAYHHIKSTTETTELFIPLWAYGSYCFVHIVFGNLWSKVGC